MTARSRAVRHALRAVSFAMLIKSMVGGSIALLALVGVAVPSVFGVDLTPAQGGAAARIGAILGVILAFKS